MISDLTHVATCSDEASAEALAGMLRNGGVPAVVRPMSPMPGVVDEVQVHVPASLAHRARWLMKTAEASDEELQFAATGELGQDED